MLRVFLHPRWLGRHLAALLVVLGCLAGAYWQFDAARQPERDALPLPENLADPVDITAVSAPGEYLPTSETNQGVTASGRYDLDHQLFTPGRSTEGEQGYYVVAPLVTADGAAVAVNRGWLPAEVVEAGAEPPAAVEDEVTVTGWLTPPQQEHAEGYTAAAVPEGHVERIAPGVLVNRWSYPVYEGSITLAEQEPADPDRLAAAPPAETPEKYDWNLRNLSYSGQWALFAVAACVFWVSLVRRELTDGGSAGSGGSSGSGSSGSSGGGDGGGDAPDAPALPAPAVSAARG